ncbi:MAG: UDP-galactopyranose mutase [Prevotella sp.]|nr:UDP-galactopyranose mutase [Prevotella sp.]
MTYDYLIVGSGLFGATFAHFAHKQGKKCLVIDKRPQLGGNVYCEKVEGINVHKYGAHIFHTNNKKVWDFVNSIVEFNRYTNSPVASYQGRLYNLPFNMNTFYQMWGVTTPAEARQKIEEQKAEAVRKMQADGVTEPRNLEEQALVLIGRDIYERLIKGYTEKQWGRKCTELPAFIIKRLPVRFVFDNNYFDNNYQGIPIGGYNKLIDGLLEGVETKTNTDFFDCRREYDAASGCHTIQGSDFRIRCKTVVYTGPIDQFFDYRFGPLDYRTVRFENEILDTPNYQGNAVINYTAAEVPYTRIIEHKHFEMFGPDVDRCPKTVISREYSTEWQLGMEPYYPVNDERNSVLYQKYKALAVDLNAAYSPQATDHNLSAAYIFGGRLAEYRYYDMAPIVERVMGLFE